MPDSKLSDKEREAKLKALRRELEEQIESDLAANSEKGSDTFGGTDVVGLQTAPGGPAEAQDTSPKRVLEALLFASGKPMTIAEIKKILPGVGAKEIEKFASELKEEYRAEGRSFELIEIAGGYQVVTRRAYASWVARLEMQRKIRQASKSALETLAILAYKQPVTRAEIEELRGVDVAAVLSTLLERGFIKIAGRKEVPGRPFLYGTTDKFLEHFGLKALSSLPSIDEIRNLVERAVRKEDLIGETETKEEAPKEEAPAEVAEEKENEPQGSETTN